MGEKYKRADRHFKSEITQLHGGQERPDSTAGTRAVPTYRTSPYVFDSCNHTATRLNLSDPENIYSRLTNLTLDVSEQKMAQLEDGVAALTTASGVAVLSYTLQNLTRAGDHIVSSGHIYGGTYNYLVHTFPEYEVEVAFMDPSDSEAVEAAIRGNTKAVFIETLGDPNSDITGIGKIASIAHRHQVPPVINNTFAMPYLVRPVEYSADTVVHSATKSIGGHGTTVSKVIVGSGRFDRAASGKFSGPAELNASYHGICSIQDVGVAAFVTRTRVTPLRDTGATLSSFHGFLFLQGLETLSLRAERHVENALKTTEHPKTHPQVEEVHHPSISQDPIQQQFYKKYFPRGDGSVFISEMGDGAEKTRGFIDNLELSSLLVNVADVKSLVTHPASTTHSQMNEKELLEQGIRSGITYPPIGTEHIGDILEDPEEAFRSVLQI